MSKILKIKKGATAIVKSSSSDFSSEARKNWMRTTSGSSEDENEYSEGEMMEQHIREIREEKKQEQSPAEKEEEPILIQDEEEIIVKKRDLDEIMGMLNEILKELKTLKCGKEKSRDEKMNTSFFEEKTSMTYSHTNFIMPLKKEVINVSDNVIMKALSKQSYLGDMIIFEEYYLRSKMSPVRSLNANATNFEYWNGEIWVLDRTGDKILDIVIHNLEICYTKVNTSDNFDSDALMKNQEYIWGIEKNKAHRRNLLKAIANH